MTFDSVDENLLCDHLNKSKYLKIPGILFILLYKKDHTFKYVDSDSFGG